MQEDKNLKDLLQKWAVEQPSPDFTSRVILQVTLDSVSSHQHKPSFAQQKILRLLLVAFVIVCVVLVVLSFTIPSPAFRLSVNIPANYFSQGLQFFIVFWIVMLLNLAVKKHAVKTM